MAADSDQLADYNNLPIKDLILTPILAASDGGLDLAKSTMNFIDTVCFDKDGNTRNLEVEVERMTKGDDDKLTPVKQKIKVPLLSVLQIPNVGITDVDVTFDMEISSHTENNSSTEDTKSNESKTSASASASGKFWGVGFSVSGSQETTATGSVTTSSSQQRSTDFSSRYSINCKAANLGNAEGMSRLTQMLAQQMDVVDTSSSDSSSK